MRGKKKNYELMLNIWGINNADELGSRLHVAELYILIQQQYYIKRNVLLSHRGT